MADPCWLNCRNANPPTVLLLEEISQNTTKCNGCGTPLDVKTPHPDNLCIRLKGDTGYQNRKTGEFVKKFSNIHFHMR